MGSNPTGATSLGDVAQRLRALACQASARRFESGRPRSPPVNPARFAGHDDFPAVNYPHMVVVVLRQASEVVILEVPVRIRPYAEKSGPLRGP